MNYEVMRKGDRNTYKETHMSSISNNQFGFMLGKSTMKAIHFMKQMIESYRARKRFAHGFY